MKPEPSALKVGAVLVVAGIAVAGWLWFRPPAVEIAKGGVDSNSEQPPAPRILRWVDRAGATLEDVGAARPIDNVTLAPRGDRLAETRTQGPASDIWLFNFRDGMTSQFTFDSSVDDNAVWSPDEGRIAFASARDGDVRNLYVRDTSGSGRDELLLKTAGSKYPTDWSRDGRYLIFTEVGSGGADIWVLPVTGDRKPLRFLTTLFSESRARFSPDGHWVAYTSNEIGAEEVFVQSFPYGRGKWRVSWTGGVEPHWRGDGRELFYIKLGAVWAVDVETSRSGLAFGYPHKLFDVPMLRAGTLVTRLNVAPDGQRFLLTLEP